MTDQPPPHGDAPDHPTVQYERSDLTFTGVATFAAGLVFALIVVVSGLWLMLQVLAGPEKPPAPRTEAGFGEPAGARDDSRSGLPPRPPLEEVDETMRASNGEGMRTQRVQDQIQKEEAQLNSTGWVEEKKGIAHIPISEAMQRLAGQLPARSGEPVDEDRRAPAVSSSGTQPRGGAK
jgi:hypothetical protein